MITHVILSVLLLATCTPRIVVHASAPTEVVILTDDTFEHDTQAATGQTTGIWCVLFTSPSQDRTSHQAAVALWESLAANEEKDIIYAMVDLDVNKKISRRFKGIQAPTAVLLKDRGMYTYSVPESDDSYDHMIGFVSGSYILLPRQSVPLESAGGVQDDREEGSFLGLDEGSLARLKWAVPMLLLALGWKALVYWNQSSLSAAHHQQINSKQEKNVTEKTVGVQKSSLPKQKAGPVTAEASRSKKDTLDGKKGK
ncbi:hypothetical protein CEUSTIGMA_g11239.t1 [Chlamydomonas eustigma]|uniref:Thioredoxin domain-containing protein n=1 Tax=Chlamydomonas eustigma TaxID=1157962 RepID=A0A250XL64_9CHLO|nr:hypothetical protein CEUSTIGMA_g11239.t1 [Chlamydomonas eustigma]|eukprot:GAX83814.1 hypothetical protein CEUSTIGMA_g11239.t1 [Chlamydomonas eustigma]